MGAGAPETPAEQAGENRCLTAMLDGVIAKNARILQVGSGDGRTLAALHDAGWTNLEGIEASPQAIEQMRKVFPQLNDVPVQEGSAEDVLPTLADDQFHVAVTVRALEQAPPQSAAAIDDLVRVAGQIFVIEHAPGCPPAQPLQDDDAAFTSRGMTALETSPMSPVPGVGRDLEAYVGRRYRRMDQKSTLHEFWRQPSPPGNNPRGYAGVLNRSAALLEIISDLPRDARILEVGCNVGRNLAYLHDHGYTSVQGVEINPHAVELLRETFPQLKDVAVHIGAAGETLSTFADDEFDLVFTMAVLEHIHPDESSVFDDMARIGKQVLAIEPQGRLSHRQFPHDIPAVFRDRGLTMVSQRSMADFPVNANDKTIHVFNAYRFERPAGWQGSANPG
jgi:SAM-dependent methyltransferase